MNEQNRRTTDDVRMRGFAQRHTVESALAWLDAQLQPLDPEPVPLRMAAGRVLAESIASDVDVPGFDRATMDGYAVAAESTEGATAYNRLPLTVIGDSMPGRPFPASRWRRSGRSNHDRRADAARLRRRAARRMGRQRGSGIDGCRSSPPSRLANMSVDGEKTSSRGRRSCRMDACCARRIWASSVPSVWERCTSFAGRGCAWW